MRIYIDADGCPVVDSTLRLAAAHRVETVILCDTSHEIQRPGVQTVTVSKGADSVDFALVNRLAPGDVVITRWIGKNRGVCCNGPVRTPVRRPMPWRSCCLRYAAGRRWRRAGKRPLFWRSVLLPSAIRQAFWRRRIAGIGQ